MPIIGDEELIDQNGKRPEEEAIIRKEKELKGIRLTAIQSLFTNGVKLSKIEDSILKGSTIGKNKAIVTVGHYRTAKRSTMINPHLNPYDETNNFGTFPFGYIHKAGSEFTFEGKALKAGDIIALFDWRTNTNFNPRFANYMVNELSNSNGERADNPPYLVLNNCTETYRRDVFVINKAKVFWDVKDHFTFMMDNVEISHLIDKKEMVKAFKELDKQNAKLKR